MENKYFPWSIENSMVFRIVGESMEIAKQTPEVFNMPFKPFHIANDSE